MTTPQRLLVRAARGDPEAFGAFYERMVDRVYHYAYYRLGDPQAVEDLTQETFLRAWDALRRHQKPPQHPEAWLFRIAHNLVVDTYRSHSSRPQQRPLEAAQALADPLPSPAQQAEQRLTWDTVVQAWQRLPDPDRDILLMRFILGLSHQETAQALGLKEGHVRVLQLRALRRLQALLRTPEVDRDPE